MHASLHTSEHCDISVKFSVSQNYSPIPRCIITDLASRFIADLPLGFSLPPRVHSPSFLEKDSNEDGSEVTIIEDITNIEGSYGERYHAVAEVELESLKEMGGVIDPHEWLDLTGLMRKSVLEILTGVDVEMARMTGKKVSKSGVRDTIIEGVLGEVKFKASWKFWAIDEQ
jgi:hypothetical protein